MVGWSRRNREASERRSRYLASLTEEQRKNLMIREAESDRKFFRGFAIFLVCLICMFGFLLARR